MLPRLFQSPRGPGASPQAAVAAALVLLLLPALSIAWAPPPACAAGPVNRTWIQPAGGAWSAPANWLNAQLPDSSHEYALLPDYAGACNVTLDLDPVVNGVLLQGSGPVLWLGGHNLWLTGAGLTNGSRVNANTGASTVGGPVMNQFGASLRVQGGAGLTLTGPTIVNNGSIFVNDNQTAATAHLTASGAVTLQGSGDLWLYNASPWAQLNTLPGATLTNAAGHTIHGTGEINAGLVNAGTVRGDWTNAYLFLRGAAKTNTGLMQASAGGWLVVDGIRVENTGGQVQADGGTVALLGGATIHGGTLGSLGSSAVVTLGNARLEALTNQGVVRLRGGDTLTFTGPAFTNNGAILINDNQTSAATVMTTAGDASLQGTGSLWLYNASPFAQLRTGAGATLTQAAGHMIHGVGDVHARLVNAGTVRADWTNNFLSLRTEPKTNTGLMQAVAGGRLLLDGVRIENAGGRIEADGGLVLLGPGAAVHGGTLASLGSSTTQTVGEARLEELTHQGWLEVGGGDTLTLAGPTFTNDGTIRVNFNQAAAAAALTADGTMTLQGSGSVWLYNAPPYAQLNTTAGSVLTNAAGHTIHGLGTIPARLVNRGTVRADVTNNHLLLTGADKINQGVMKSTAGAWLTLDHQAVANDKGEIRAEGGNVLLATGTRVTGGTLASSAGGAIYTSGGPRLEALALQGTVRAASGDTLVLGGPMAVTNDATIYVNYNQGGAPCRLMVDGDVPMQGAGSIYLYAGGAAAQVTGTPGSILRNVNGHTIHGFGEINAQVQNTGTLSADVLNQALTVTHAASVNLGTAGARQGGWLVINDPAANYAGGTLSGGLWQVEDNSTLWLNGATITANQAAIVLDGANSRVIRDASANDALAGLATNGAGAVFTIRNGRNFTTAGSFQNAGELVVGKGSVFRVGPAATGDYTQLSSGALRFRIAGRLAGEAGQVRVAGAAQLAGTLSAQFDGGFAPVLGDTFQVMTFGSRTGAFEHFEAPIVNGLRLTPTVYANRIVLTALAPSVAVEDPVGVPAALALAAHLATDGAAQLDLSLPAAADVSLELYDVRGRRVATLCAARLEAGVRSWRLDGIAGAGVYFARATASDARGTEVRTARVVLLR